jgi:hypothetical protein
MAAALCTITLSFMSKPPTASGIRIEAPFCGIDVSFSKHFTSLRTDGSERTTVTILRNRQAARFDS